MKLFCGKQLAQTFPLKLMVLYFMWYLLLLLQMYADYDENEIGALDCDEIEGHVDESDEILLQYADEFEKHQRREQMDKDAAAKRVCDLIDEDLEIDEQMVGIEVKEKEKWDCESILSTYSNIYNHPKLIVEPKVSDLLPLSLYYKLANFV